MWLSPDCKSMNGLETQDLLIYIEKLPLRSLGFETR